METGGAVALLAAVSATLVWANVDQHSYQQAIRPGARSSRR
jgi:hypothetical protein